MVVSVGCAGAGKGWPGVHEIHSVAFPPANDEARVVMQEAFSITNATYSKRYFGVASTILFIRALYVGGRALNRKSVTLRSRFHRNALRWCGTSLCSLCRRSSSSHYDFSVQRVNRLPVRRQVLCRPNGRGRESFLQGLECKFACDHFGDWVNTYLTLREFANLEFTADEQHLGRVAGPQNTISEKCFAVV